MVIKSHTKTITQVATSGALKLYRLFAHPAAPLHNETTILQHPVRFMLILYLFLISIIAYGSEELNKETDLLTPVDFIQSYEKALSTQNWDNVQDLIHPDCVVTFTNGTYKGKPAVEQVFRKNFELIKNENYSITNIHFVIEKPDYAVFIFNYNWSGIINGKPAKGGGRGTSVIVRSNGRWQLISEHLGPNA